jgi:AcrR family transcriptional regulator
MKQRKKQPDVTRQAILHATGEEFALHGYSGTGLGAIVSRSELTKGALFHHFSDKRSLAATWVFENLTSGIGSIWGEPLSEIGSLDAMKAFCRTRSLEIRSDDAPSILVSLAAECSSDPVLGPALASVHSAWRAAIAGLLDRGKADGWIHRSIQPAAEAAFLVSAFCGFTIAAKCSPDEGARRSAALEGYLETLRAQ